jgi:hypothetical protein
MHNREKFEVYCISLFPDPQLDSVGEEVKKGCDAFYSLGDMPWTDVARQLAWYQLGKH